VFASACCWRCAWCLTACPISGVCGSNERLVRERLKESSKKLRKLIQELDLSRGLLLHCSRDVIESRAKVNLKF
jgi:Fe-S-cluster-containing hydrogenase component 2